MTFVNPLALLGLIGVPILIIIYIIKNKYTEQTIASNYIWHLSERFLKNKKPVSKLNSLISLILQCLMVVTLSITLAHPKFIVTNGAKEYCFILDGSASMNIVSDDISRFDEAKNKIKEVINSSYDGSKYSLVYVGNSTSVVYEQLTNKEDAISMLDSQSCAYLSNNTTTALIYAQQYFDSNPSVKTYIATDRDYQTTNIELLKVGKNEENYAVDSVSYKTVDATYDKDGNITKLPYVIVDAKFISYNAFGKVNASLYDDNVLIETKEIDFSTSDNVEVFYEYSNINFDYLEIRIDNEDSLELDNTYIVYNLIKEHEYKALIVSDSPFYIKNIMASYGISEVDVIATKDYVEKSGYSLYVFDSFVPQIMPKDGSIWLFDQKGSPESSGISYKETITPLEGAKLELASSSSSLYKKLTNGMINSDMYVREYNRYGLYSNFTTLLTANNNPVVLAGTNNYGNTEIVFAFNIHNTNLPLTYNYLVLFKNLLDYSFPQIIEEANYVCGEEININFLSAIKYIKIETPNGSIRNYVKTSNKITYKLQEIGTYKITVVYDNYDKVFNIYSAYPLEENIIDSQVLELNGTALDSNLNGTYDNLMIFYVLLTLLFVADWMVYCYEQYQLR